MNAQNGLSFPIEILEKIFQTLESSDIYSCSLVCRIWRSVIFHGFINPLFIPKVVGRIFTFLPFESILACRQVCKHWHTTLDTMTFAGFTPWGVTITEKIDLPDLLGAKGFTNHNPFPTRHLAVLFECQMELSRCTNYFRDIHELLKMYGNQVKYLTIAATNATSPSTWTTLAVLFTRNALQYTPNLVGLAILPIKYLCIQSVLLVSLALAKWRYMNVEGSCNCDHKFDEKNKPIFLSIVDQYRHEKIDLPHLRVLSIQSVSPLEYLKILEQSPNCHFVDIKVDLDSENVMLHLFPLNFRPKHEHITSLRLTLNWDYFCIVAKGLWQAKLNLRWLALCICLYNVHGESRNVYCCCLKFRRRHKCFHALHHLLRSYGNCVQTLDLSIVGMHPIWEWRPWTRDYHLQNKFPSGKYLSKVETFRLTGFRGSLSFLRKMGALKRLYLSPISYQKQKVFVDEDSFFKYLPQLRKLVAVGSPTIYGGYEDWKDEVLNDKQYFVEKKLVPVLWTTEIEKAPVPIDK